MDYTLLNNLRFLATKTDGEEGVCRAPQSTLREAADMIEKLQNELAEAKHRIQVRDRDLEWHKDVIGAMGNTLNYIVTEPEE